MHIKSVPRLILTGLLIGTLCWTPAGAFSSEPAAWAANQMNELNDAGLYEGLNSWGITPASPITRGQFCKMMVNLIQAYGREDKLAAVSPMPAGYFADLASTVTASAPGGQYDMYYAAAYGLSAGDTRSDGTRVANPSGRLNREQAATMMCALADALEQYVGADSAAAGEPKQFADRDSISGWAQPFVDRASSLSFLAGDPDGNFNPQGTLSWEEASVMVFRSYESAERALLAREEALGIHSLKTGLELSADHYLNNSSSLYLLEHNGARSVLQLDGGSYDSRKILLETYHADGSSAGVREIPMELSKCAAFYEGENNYYLAFGQDNMEENNSKEVYRVVKYDKSWKRLGAASVTGGQSYTTIPFDFTSHTSMAEENGTLVLHTARQRYLTSDNLRHQSNITIKINTADMSVTNVSGQFPSNHVSHSFAQYVAFDSGLPVYADHGDAYPRGFALNVEDAAGSSTEQVIFPFAGTRGDNTTNAIPGGLGVAADHYLFAGASSPQKGNDNLKYCNAFLAVVPKDSFPNGTPQIKWLSGFPKNGKEYVPGVKMVQLNNNTFVVMWQSEKVSEGASFPVRGDFRYAVFDGKGNQVGSTVTKEGYAVPFMDPTVVGNRILWVRPQAADPASYSTSRSKYLKFYELDITPNTPANPSGASITMDPAELSLAAGEKGTVKASIPGAGAASYRSSDWTVANVDQNGNVSALKEGTCTITGTVTWRGRSYSAQCKVTVTKAPVVSLTLDPKALTLAVGDSQTLKADIANASPAPTVSYYTSNRYVATVDSSGKVKALRAGTATITAYMSWQNRSYSGTCTVTVSAAPTVTMSPASLSLTAGQTGSVRAAVSGIPSSPAPAISYTSSDTSVATVDSRGNVSALKAGRVTITASVTSQGQTYSAECILTVAAAEEVSLSLDASSLELAAGDSRLLKATVLGTSYTPEISFSSSNPAVAVVDSQGTVSAKAAGRAAITASMTWQGQSYTAVCEVTVSAAPANVSLALSPRSLELTAGESAEIQVSSTGVPDSTVISFRSDNIAVAAVDSQGTVSAKAAGRAAITASMTWQGQSYTAVCEVTVSAAPANVSLALSPRSLELTAGESAEIQVSAAGAPDSAAVSFRSSDTVVASVDRYGTVSALNAGTATITVTLSWADQSVSEVCDVTVKLSNQRPNQGGQTGSQADDSFGFHDPECIMTFGEYAPSIYDSRGNEIPDSEIEWKTESPQVLKLFQRSGSPIVSPVSLGTGRISATWKGRTVYQTITVVPAERHIALSMGYTGLYVGRQSSTTLYVYRDTIFYEKDYSVSWSVDDPSLLDIEESVNARGEHVLTFTGKAPGKARITCRVTLSDGTYADAYCYVNVTDR